MSEDIQKGSTFPQPEELWQGRPEGPKPDLKPPPYPKTIVAAGVMLIVVLGLWLLALVAACFTELAYMSKPEGGWPMNRLAHSVGVLTLVMMLVCLESFLWPAISFVRAKSTAKGTGVIGGFLVALGLYFAFVQTVGWWFGPPGAAWFPFDSFQWASGTFFLASIAAAPSAGILFLVGRAPYRAWRNAEDARKKNGPPKEGGA